MRKLFLIILLASGFSGYTQIKENTGWLLYLNNVKLNEHWAIWTDIQFRSGDDARYLRTAMFRPGVQYLLNKNQNLTVGYLLQTTNRNLDGVPNNILIEQRAWEQFIQTHKLGRAFASHRFRLEQRFIEQAAGDEIFAQRFRYFNRFLLPLVDYRDKYTRGPFVALQNEVFLHIQHKEKLNGSVFDQNRLYLALGYRLSSKLDLEAGYLNQLINGRATNTVNHVGQLAVYTRF